MPTVGCKFTIPAVIPPCWPTETTLPGPALTVVGVGGSGLWTTSLGGAARGGSLLGGLGGADLGPGGGEETAGPVDSIWSRVMVWPTNQAAKTSVAQPVILCVMSNFIGLEMATARKVPDRTAKMNRSKKIRTINGVSQKY